MTPGALLTVSEAAEYLGRSREFVRGLIREGLVDGRQHRGRWYITRASIDRWLAQGSKDPGPPEKIYSPPRQW